jgi:hypothetical protein
MVPGMIPLMPPPSMVSTVTLLPTAAGGNGNVGEFRLAIIQRERSAIEAKQEDLSVF